MNPFDFNDINQQGDEIILNGFLDLAENNKTKNYRTPVFDLVLDSQRDKYPFILNVEFIINDAELFQVNRFYKDSDQLTNSIEKMIDKHDETLEVLFSGYMIKYTMVFNQIKRSNYGKGCGVFSNILKYKGKICYIPTGNVCFRKCSEHIYKRHFSNEYKEFISDSERCKNIMTSAKIQPFCRKCNINLGVYNKKQRSFLPKSVAERRICLLIHNNHFCVIWKTNQSTFPDAIAQIENNFRYEETQINDNILQQVIEYKFLVSYEMGCLYNVFAFDLETCNVDYSEHCEPYAAVVYHPNNFYWCFNGNLDKEELAIERSKVHVFDREN